MPDLEDILKGIALVFAGLLFAGCATTRYYNEYGRSRMRDGVEYEKIMPNLRWENSYPHGCPVMDFYRQFGEYDEIVDVSITERIDEIKFFSFVISKRSFCSYSGMGIVFKKSGRGEVLSRRSAEIRQDTTPALSTEMQIQDTIPEMPAPVDTSEAYFPKENSPEKNRYLESGAQEKSKENARLYQKAMKKRIEASKARNQEKPAEDLSSHGNDNNAKRN